MYSLAKPMRISSVADLCAGLVILIGSIALLGWLFNIEIAKSVLPDLATMKADTALCFVLSGITLLGVRHHPQNLIFILCAILVIAIGFATLITHILFLMLDIRQVEIPGRMSTATALAFSVSGSALLLLFSKGWRLRSQWLSLIVLLIAAVALLGYFYNVDALYRLFMYSSMALNTAAAFFLLSIGLLFAHPDLRLYQLFSHNTAAFIGTRRLIFGILITPILSGWVILRGEQAGFYEAPVSFSLFSMLCVAALAAITYRNITQLERMENTQRSIEHQIHYQASLLEHVSDAVIATDADFVIRFWGKAAQQIYGWKPEEVQGKHVRDFLKTTYLNEGDPAQVQGRFQEKGMWQGEVIQYTRNGEPVNILSSVVLMRDRNSHPIGTIAVNRDISWRKDLESRLVDSEKQRVLMEAERQLVELRQRLVTMVSHDFRTPLTVILTSSELLQKYQEKMSVEKQQKALGQITAQVSYMRHLLDDVLIMSRAQAGKLECNAVMLDFKKFCEDTLQQIQLADGDNHNIELHYRFPGESATLDPLLLRRILDNLLSNAIKYSPTSSVVTLKIWVEGERIYFSVRDQGIGIPEQDQSQIFDIFHRAQNAQDISGSGWGLAIVNESVRAHGGEISFKSVEGEGTTFTFWLPNP